MRVCLASDFSFLFYSLDWKAMARPMSSPETGTAGSACGAAKHLLLRLTTTTVKLPRCTTETAAATPS